jgi:hypothetical protein
MRVFRHQVLRRIARLQLIQPADPVAPDEVRSHAEYQSFKSHLLLHE